MLKAILGSKGKISQSFVEGRRVAVNKIITGPCVVTQVKSMDKDGYWGVQLGLGERKTKNMTKSMLGHLRGAIKETKAPKFLAEIRLDKEPSYKVGDKITVSDLFSVGDYVSVTGISKGKGFAGGVKRWHFKGGPRTHGQSDRERAPGSIGQTTTPGRVLKGKHMAGRMGSNRVTVTNLQIISLDPEKNQIEVSGPVPGKVGSNLIIKRISKGKLEGITEVAPQIVEGQAEAETTKNNQEKKEGEINA